MVISMTAQNGMLLVLPVPLRVKGNKILFEWQACNGLERWADNFGSLVVAAPTLPESLVEKNKSIAWKDTATLANPQRFEFVPLPWTTSLLNFFSHYFSTRTALSQIIEQCQYRQFALGGSVRDWGALAALEACRQKKPYAIHTDIVDYKAVLQNSKDAKLPKRLKARMISSILAVYHRSLFRRAALALLHGADCYQAYSSFCKNSYLIHNIHTKPSDCISQSKLAEKCSHTAFEETLRICYVGRLEPMKAPLDWLKAIEQAKNLGVNLHATWMGDGSLFQEMKDEIAARGLSACVQLAGFEQDRSTVLELIRESHLMVFTHITPESPRCLIEGLICGTPIVGYQNHFAEDLIKRAGGGKFVPVGNWKELGNLISRLAADRQQLAKLIQQAGRSGAPFNDKSVFLERSELIKRHLP
jgi:glycosyltransferase involved in cell wall biosynthesis